MNAFFAMLIFVAVLVILMGFYFLFMVFLRKERREILVQKVQAEPTPPLVVQQVVQEPLVPATPVEAAPPVVVNAETAVIYETPPPLANPESAVIYQDPPPPTYTEPAPIAAPPQALVQRSPILDVENPVVQTVLPEALPATGIPTPDIINTTNLSEDKSPAGVRYSSNPSGRRIRDKRYNRNASN